MISKNDSIGIRIVSFFVVFTAFCLIVRLFSLQVLNTSVYKERADNQYFTSASLDFNRGNIYLTKKDGGLISAATVVSGYRLFINPSVLTDDYGSVYEKLNSVISLERDFFIQKASKKDDPYEELAVRVSAEDIDKIMEFDIEGVGRDRQKWRFYPGGSLLSKTLGFVAFNKDKLEGRYGLEKFYDDVLKRGSEDKKVNLFAEIFLSISDTFFSDDSKEGDLVTTLEPVVSQTLEKELFDILNKLEAENTGGIIINPKTGEIFAMSHLPDFDLNNFSKVSSPLLYGNPLVENVFEFGSVVKPLVFARAIEEKLITSDTPFYDAGSVKVEDKIINNFDKKGRGQITMQIVLSESLNTGMVYLTNLLGKEKMRKNFYDLGFGKKTGIDLPNEARGLVSNLESPRMLEYANASFGQGIAITPIQAVKAFSALANGGKEITPHLVSRINYKKGGGDDVLYENMNEIFKKESTNEVTRMMVWSVDNVYMGGKMKIQNYSIAGKTGTAQIAKEDGMGYYENKHTHSFFGYFPAYDPEFLVFLYVRDPKGVRYASESLINPFLNITKFLINYYEIPPDR